ncbi:hypothetical protein AB0C13_11925 [Streptomyces sp. NPDC049099]
MMWLGWRKGLERYTFAKFLLFAGSGIASEGLMVVFYKIHA